jgi:membrane protein insertase Oxa1/YidC/SpoIIIJ
MRAVLYTIIIYPIEQIVGLCFLFIYRIFSDPGIALCGVSAAISVLTLPLYFAAEKWQILERETIRRLSPKISRIKRAFSGDEQYLILATYYRQNHYRPFYALRSSFGLLVQVPFFIAAYLFISNLAVLKGTPFLFIRDLGVPDGLLAFGMRGANINVLPILMTLINCAAGAVYTKGFPLREKLQIYGTALVFLVLLYNAPSALVLYWTLNNVFSLIKNILQKTPNAKKIVFIVLCVFTVLLNGYLLFFHTGALSKRAAVCVVAIAVCVLWAADTFFTRRFDDAYAGFPPHNYKQNARFRLILFLLVSFNLLLLSGAVIPLSLIASSPQEFSFIEPYRSPFPLAWDAFLQAAGFFLFLPFCLYALLSRRIKAVLTLLLAMLLSAALVNTFFIQGSYGNISNVLTFENPALIIPPVKLKILSVTTLLVTVSATALLFAKLPLKVLIQGCGVLAFALGAFSLSNAYGIQQTFAGYAEQEARQAVRSPYDGVYTFSKTGKNVLVIMLDRALSGYTPALFTEKPHLYDTFSGFTWYPNTVSLGGNTLLGSPPLYGGYEYAPGEMQKRGGETLVEKHNEALIMLPRLFAENDWITRVMDPPWANYSWTPDISIYAPYPAINARNIIGDKMSALWRGGGQKEYEDLPLINIGEELHKKLFRFSLFKFAPAFMRFFIYDNGDWLLPAFDDDKQISRTLMNEYAALDILPEITAATKEKINTFTSMSSGLTHTPAFLQAPDYTLTAVSTDKGAGAFANEKNYHVSMAAFLRLSDWFQFLKDNNVYDNTRIIIVSDHGENIKNDIPGNITLPGGESLNSYNALLMVKDFNAHGSLETNNAFMTNADVPCLAAGDVIENPVNPFTGKPLVANKQHGVFVVSASVSWRPKMHYKNTFKIGKNDMLFVKDNIFKNENWKIVER